MLLAFLQLGCSTGNSYRYKIGVSQCVGGPWRDKVNNEMLSAQHLYDTDVEVTIVDANNNNARQCEQIDSMVNSGVDLLIVSPNDYYALDKSLQRAKEKQIPIVFFDRKTSFNDYTAYIGGDNVDAGRQMGRYTAKLCRDSMVAVKTRRPVVLEIKGPEEISPSAERHKGFAEEMRQHADINYQCVPSSWSYEDSKSIMEKWLSDGKPVDVVFCHSDNATMGAYDAAKKVGRERDIKFLGIDGLPGEGIEAVQRGQLEASYIYPTHGEEVIALALNILEHKAYKRDNILKSFVVTPANVADIAISSNALINQNKYLTTIQGKLETYLGFYHIQRTLLLVLLLVVVLLVTAVGMTLRAVTVTRRANRRMREMNDEQTRFFTNASHQLRTPLTLIAGPLQQLLKGHLMNGTDKAEQSAGDKATNADTLRLLNIMKRNVEQLQQLVNDVLLFRKETNATVDDTTAVTDELKAESLKAVQENRHKIAVNDSADELATVLVVDDNADMRAYLRTLLLDRYYVIEASDGQSGLHLAVESVPDIVVSDVGAHKMWIARHYDCYEPNTCLISNGFASMGFSIPGAFAAKLLYPDKKVLAVCGDGGFMMNSQELETAVREKVPFVTLIWEDSSYGLIKWKEQEQFGGEHCYVDFTNLDFKMLAEAMHCKGYRVEKAEDLIPTLEEAFRQDVPSVIVVPVDYSENMKLSEHLKEVYTKKQEAII